MSISADNLALVPPDLDEEFLKLVICGKSRGMVHFCGHFNFGEDGFWKLLRCDYPDKLLFTTFPGNGKVFAPLADEIKRLNAQKFPPDLYYTIATFYGSASDNIHSLRGVWVDLDAHHGSDPLTIFPALRYADLLTGACDAYHLPAPWVVYTGRGLQLVWVFRDAVPCGARNKANARKLGYTLRRLCQWFGALCSTLGLPLEADANCTNLSRLLRVPGSYNSHTVPAVVSQVLIAGAPCAWGDFVLLGTEEAPTAPTSAVMPVLPTPALAQSVALSRLERLQAWCAGRGYDITGLRNVYLHLCAVMLVGQGCEDVDKLLEINNKLTTPLTTAEVLKTMRSACSHRYIYSNAKIASVLAMSSEEAQAFRAVCKPGYVLGGVKLSPRQLAQLYGDTRKPHRARDEARAQRKAAKTSLYAQIPGLLAQGYSYAAVGQRLGLPKSTVIRHKNGD